MKVPLSPEQLERGYELFHELDALPDCELSAALDDRCSDDPTLRAWLVHMLELAKTAGDDDAYRGRLDALTAGDEVGRYQVRRAVGEGAMGTIYEAEQTRPVRRRVALKVVKLGMDTKHVIARFEAERQALARLSHPNIASVFDAGVTDDGRSFFAMEFVDGAPITRHVEEQGSSLAARLDLFLQVCAAVQHAHQNGIIHRDLKPSNILVEARNGSATVKVIDFGVAKATGERLTERTLFTADGRLMGTPEYMSPEQAGLSDTEVDTRSDVYALGVLLYQLITGVLPFEPGELRSGSFDEMCRRIREAVPAQPSARVVGRRLGGDLDRITMKAMAKDRAVRYQSAHELAADVGRYLRREPVLATSPGAWYRLRKAAIRHPARTASAILGSVLLGGGLVAIIVLAILSRAADRAAEAHALLFLTIGENVVHHQNAPDPEAIKRVANRLLRGREVDTRQFANAMIRCEIHGAPIQTPDDPGLWMSVGSRHHAVGWEEPIIAVVRPWLTVVPGEIEATDWFEFDGIEVELGRHREQILDLNDHPEHPGLGERLRRPGAFWLSMFRYSADLYRRDERGELVFLAAADDIMCEPFNVYFRDDETIRDDPVDLRGEGLYPVDLSDWVERDRAHGGSGIWVIRDDGMRAQQLMNGSGTFLFSPKPWRHQRLVATVRVNTYHDDDTVGIVLGFRSMDHPYLTLGWAGGGGGALRLWTAGTDSVLLARDPDVTSGREPYRTYRFELEHDPAGSAAGRIVDHETGEVIFDSGRIECEPFPAGCAGFVTISQRHVTFQAWAPNSDRTRP